jgi:hypothetical protein
MLLLCLFSASALALDFTRDVQPILERACFECHGPDAKRGGLRLANQDDALAPADSGAPAIKPGNAADSPLIARITSTDKEARMPKDEAPLSAAEIAILRQWIDAGAEYPKELRRRRHWAYVAPKRAELPALKAKDWPVNAIDYFVLDRLEAEGLQPQPEADKGKLLRRASLVLTGLPPSVEELDAFDKDDSPEAYEKAIDRLLSSQRYGERWARPWLDLARYADSNGFQADQLRDSWAYRDWVIKALNDDMPFDQFVIEQLAGDLIPNATVDQKIATGFHRTVTCNVEAGVHPEENRTNQVFDRVNTTGMAFLGTTLECAQCHSHKYDPFTMTDYYRLFAFFNNTPIEVKQAGGVRYDFIGPKMSLPLDAAQRQKVADLEAQLAELQAQKARAQEERGSLADWEKEMIAALRTPPEWQVLTVDSFTSNGGEDHEILEDQSVLLGGSVPGTATYVLSSRTELTNINGFKLECLTHESLPGTGPGRGDELRNNFVLNEFTVTADGQPVELHSAKADFSQDRFDVAQAIDGDAKTAWAIAPQFKKPHWATFQTKEPLGETTLSFTLDQQWGRGRVIGRLRLSALLGDPSALDVPDAVRDALLAKKRSKKHNKTIADFYAKSIPGAKRLDAEIASVKKALDKIQPPTTLVMVEMEEPRETHILSRGNYLNKGVQVQPGTPASLPPMDPDLPKNRLGFAKWLTNAENPLLSRVTVNRFWQEFFVTPLVSTPEDFGTRADPPTHPRLLDWLAVEFIENGWSMKQLHKTIAMSASFRQRAGVTPELLEIDPVNTLYTRGPRFRMPAEMVRDNALQISGLLSTRMGGKPIMPYQPDGLWRQVGRNEPKWVNAPDERRFRRGIYVVWRRAAPYPSFVNFDAPDRAACVVQRPRTNTPLQALTLLNDPAYVEMALGLALRVVQDRADADVAERIRYGFRRCTGRLPKPSERKALQALYDSEHARLSKSPELAAEMLAGIAAVAVPKDLDKVELAAWLVIANALLNLDETISLG